MSNFCLQLTVLVALLIGNSFLIRVITQEVMSFL
jgi:hypothetical protein